MGRRPARRMLPQPAVRRSARGVPSSATLGQELPRVGALRGQQQTVTRARVCRATKKTSACPGNKNESAGQTRGTRWVVAGRGVGLGRRTDVPHDLLLQEHLPLAPRALRDAAGETAQLLHGESQGTERGLHDGKWRFGGRWLSFKRLGLYRQRLGAANSFQSGVTDSVLKD